MSSQDGVPSELCSSPVRPESLEDVKPDISDVKLEVLPFVPPVMEEDEDDEAIYSDEDNPFEALALTQMIPDDIVEVNPNMIQSNLPPADMDEDDYDMGQQAHQADTHRRAQESAQFRATQAPRDESDYDDDELDELFRQTVTAGLVTPRKNRNGTSLTPTSAGSSGSLTTRRYQRDQRLREQAGLGDLR